MPFRALPRLGACQVLANEQANLVVYDPRVAAEAISVGLTRDDGSQAAVTVEKAISP